MSDTRTKKRIIYLDYLRVIAITGVLLNHISQNWTGAAFLNEFIALFYNSAGRIGVPLFLMLTGILLLNNKLPIKDFIKRRYPRVILPFLFWMILYILCKLFVWEPSLLSGNPLQYAIVSFLSDRWYVWMILGVYLMIPVFAGFIKGTKLDGVKYFLIIWLITTALITLSKTFGFNLHYLDLVIYSGPIGFLMLGYYLHNKEIKMSPKKVIIISLLVFVILTIVKAFLLSQYLDLSYSFRYYIFTVKSHLENDTLSIIQVAALFLIVKYIPMVKSGFYQKITEFCNRKRMLLLIISISQASYGIYLCHYFITYILKDILKAHQIAFSNMPSIVVVPFLTIAVLLLAYAIILIANKIPVIKKFTGYH